ncbi:MAG: ATP-binding cassette domain-containing protein [Deltaproteobacteria bacterium]|nr:ATP-binding cassette domain-containing protein [Deltaproteobacteria bacterium]
MTHPLSVEVRGLVARYADTEVLHGVDLEVRRGEVHVIVGGSGCGKSTLLRHIIGLLRPAAGSVRLLGVDQASADEPEWERVLQRIGVLFQGGALINSLSLFDNVALPLRERAPDLSAAIVREIVLMKVAQVGLLQALHLTPPQLSGGMRKRAALARAMALDPEVLFCDEPSAGLDPVTAADLDRLILSLNERFGMSIVVVTHELASIDSIASHVTMLAAGRVVATGPLAEVKRMDRPEIVAFFNRVGKLGADGAGSVLEALQRGGRA